MPDRSPVRIFHEVVPGDLDVEFVWQLASLRSFELGPEVVDFSLELARVRDSRPRDPGILQPRVFPCRRMRVVINVKYPPIRVDALFPA